MNGAKIRRKKKDRVREDMKKHVYFFFGFYYYHYISVQQTLFEFDIWLFF